MNFFTFNLKFFVLFLIISISFDYEFFLCFYNLFFLHLFLGLNSIFSDYIHLKILKITLNFILKLILLEFTLIVLELNF